MSLEACPCPQTLFLPTVTFCSKQCPLCKKSLRNMVIRKFSLSPEMLLSVPCNASPVSQSPSPCSFSAGVQGISDFSPMLNHSIYRNMSETAETKQVKHTACHKITDCYPEKLMESLGCFIQTTVKSLLHCRRIQGWGYLQAEIEWKSK